MHVAGRSVGIAFASLVAAFFVGPGSAFAVTDVDSSRFITRPSLVAEPNAQSGAFQQSHPFTVPQGRNGMEPSLNLQYSSGGGDNMSEFGYGWSLSIPSIQRNAKHGTDDLYTRHDFSSSLSGELSDISLSDATHGTFGAKVDDGSMLEYTYSTSEVWTVVDKDGTTYTFGGDSSARVADPSDATHVFRWMLTGVEDRFGNTVTYTYTTDGAQVYPSTINYTGFGTAAGIFDVSFTLESRGDSLTSYASGFAVTTSYRVSALTVAMDSQTIRSYALAYGVGDGGLRSLLTSITETATTEDGASSLSKPATTFTYADGNTAWASSSITFPETIAGDGAGSLGVYLFDMNGDAIPDIIKSRDTNRAIYTGNADGTWTASSVAVPLAFSSPIGKDMGVRVMDMNGDGTLDLVYARYGSTGILSQSIYINNNDGTGWTLSTTASVPIGFTTDGGLNIGVEVFDADGDGLSDIVKSRDGASAEVYINNGDGTGWTLTSGYSVPVYFATAAPADMGVRPMDVNGDGLTDLVYARYLSGTLSQAVYINMGNGTGWVQDTSWTVPVGFLTTGSDFGVRPMDVNGDGLVDFVYHRDIGTDIQSVYINTGKNWVLDSSITTPLAFTNGAVDLGVRVDDFNADGLPDMLKSRNISSTTTNELYLASGEKADVLTEVTTSQGVSTTVVYGTSVNGNNSEVPFVLQVAESITSNDGLGNIATKTYTYADGDYYYASEFDRNFAGFGTMTATDADGSTTYFYHQGNSTNNAEGESTDASAKIGKQYREERADTAGHVYQTSIDSWDSTNLGADRDFVYRSQHLELLYGSTSTHTDHAIAFSYDADGNVTQQSDYGTVTGTDSGSVTDTGTDTRITTTSYATDSAGILRNKPSQTSVIDSAGTTVAQSVYLYDSLPYGSISTGNVTTEQRWISGTTYASTTFTSDAYGNVLTTTLPNGGVQTVVYESTTQQYPTTSTNDLAQTTTTAYARSIGKPTSVTNPNGSIVTTTYDAFGRPTLEQQSSDANATTMVTTKTWSYDDASSPRSVTTREYLSATVYKESIAFLDGFDRVIQSKTLDATGTGYNESQTTYDDLGRVASSTLPEASSSSAYNLTSVSSALAQSFSYDALSRVTLVSDALGSTSTSYDGLIKTVTDALGNTKSYTMDGLGRLISVVEYISGVPYTTSYTYNATDALTGITDSMGNVRAFTYDGRNLRLTAQDLHAPTDTTFGTWTFTFDASGSISTSVSPNGITTTYAYDTLNRVSTEDASSTTGVDVAYTYDSCTNGVGALCTTSVNGGASTENAYTANGRVSSEVKTVSSVAYTTTTTYDYAGNPLTITHPDGTIVRNTYNAIGALATVEEKAPSDTSYTMVTSAFAYGPDGQLTVQTNGNGTVTTNTYDATKRYRLTQKVTTGMGEASTTTSAPTTVSFYPSAGDGYAQKNNASWDTAHDATSGSGVSGTGTTAVAGTAKTTTNYLLYRSLLPFDTSSLPDDATVTSTTLQLYVQSKINNDNDSDDFVTVVQSTQASATALAIADYGRTGATDNPIEGIETTERKDLSSVAANAWLTFALNATGQGFVSKTGITNLALREGHDVIDSPFTSSSTTTSQYNYLLFRTSEYAGTTYDPVLTITYTTTSTTAAAETLLQDLSYTYDAVGNIASIVDASDQTTAKTTAYTYDDLYRLTEESVTGSANGDDTAITYTYDSLGNITYRSDKGTYTYGGNAGTSYANAHAVTSILKTDGTTQSFVYDNNGNVTNDETNTYTWDYKNRLVSSAVTATSTTTTSTTVTFYPSAGDGQTYKYNASWDTAHDATSGSSASGATTSAMVGTAKTTTSYYVYRDLLPFDTSSLPDDATITSTSLQLYVTNRLNNDNDGDDFVTVVQSTQASATALATADYGRTGATNNPTEGIDTSERKDITSISTSAWLTFALNSTGQGFVSKTGVTNLALREGHDVIDSAFTSSSTTTSQYNYISFRTSEYAGTTYDPLLTVTYTQSATTTSTTSAVAYAYDAFDSRVSKVVTTPSTGAAITTVYPSSAYSIEDGTSTVYVGGPAGVSLASMENVGSTSSTLSTIAVDHLGSTAVLSNSSGAMTELLDYHGYGNSRLTSGSATAKKTFIGQYSDSETSLSYLNARYYNPTQGQFLSEDSVFLGMGTSQGDLLLLLSDPQSQNSYGYGRDNPISSSDPTGKSWWTGFKGFTVGAVTALAVGVAVGAAIATLPISGPALAVMAVAGGLGTIAAVAESVTTTNRAYASGTITADQRDYNYGNVLGNVVGGVAGGVVGSRAVSGMMTSATSTQSVASIRGNLGNAVGRTVNGDVSIPADWIKTPTNSSGGFKYTNPNIPSENYRLMPGNPNSPYEVSRSPYLRHQVNGGYTDSSGRISSDQSQTHFPIREIK